MPRCTNLNICSAILLGLLLAVGTGCGADADEASPGVSTSDLERSMIPREARGYLIKANDALNQGAYHAALSLVDSAEAVKDSLSDADFIRGRVYTELKQFDRAEKAYRRVLERSPEFEGLRLNLGNNAFRQGQFREAIRWYKQEREQYPSGTVWLHLGRSYDQMEQTDSAARAYRKAISFDTTTTAAAVRADAHVRLAQLLQDRGNVDEGLGHARQAVNLVPEAPGYRYVLGSLQFRAGNFDGAARQLQKVVEQNPQHQSAQYKLGQTLVRLGREEEAEGYLAAADSLQKVNQKISQLRTLAEQNPGEPQRWIQLGQALREAGRLREAMEAYQVVLSMQPENKPLQMMLANLALRSGHSTQAVQRYRAVLRQDSTFADAWVNMGVVFATSGQPDRARSAWKQALALEPDNKRVKAYLARLDRQQ